MVRFPINAEIMPDHSGEWRVVQRIVLVLQKSILRISAKRNQNYLIEDVIILSNNNGNRMVRLLVTAVVIPEES